MPLLRSDGLQDIRLAGAGMQERKRRLKVLTTGQVVFEKLLIDQDCGCFRGVIKQFESLKIELQK